MEKKHNLTLEDIGSFLEKLAEKSESVYWLSSPDFTKIQYVSPAYEKIWGRSRDIIYKNPELWITYLHPEDVNSYHPIHAMADRIAQIGGSARYEENYRIVRPDGEIRWIIDRGFPIYDRNGRCCGVTGVAVDITKDKLAEESLRKEKKKVEAANKAKSEFIANMSHDLRTPITGMTGMIQDILDTVQQFKATLSEDQYLPNKQYLKLAAHIENDGNILMNSTSQLLQLCNEILEVTRLSNGVFDKAPESFSLRELVQHNIELLMPTARNKKINLTADIDQRLPRYIQGLKEYINRALLNLLSNALKFTAEGYVKLTVLLIGNKLDDYKAGDQMTIQFIVEDTGVGIPEDKFDVVFEHFSRLTPSYEGVYQGTGLGLYTVKRYVEAMKGSIALESTVNQGSRFIITVPVLIAENADESPRFQKNNLINLHPNWQNHIVTALSFETNQSVDSAVRVLVVEDNQLAAMAISLAIKPFNCVIDFADHGAEAVSKVIENDYQLIFMDIGLPDFSGIEATQKIRALSDVEKARVPIVALTGHADNPDMLKECMDAGMQDVLIKPTNHSLLYPIFHRYVFAKRQINK